MQASPYPPPAGWRPPRRSTISPATIAVLILVVVFLVATIALIIVASLNLGTDAAFSLVAPFCGMFVTILIVVVIALAAGGSFRRQPLPPPPPIQQPMVPAGMEGPVALNCPNCGAPPTSIDRFGVAICAHCGARFIVR